MKHGRTFYVTIVCIACYRIVSDKNVTVSSLTTLIENLDKAQKIFKANENEQAMRSVMDYFFSITNQMSSDDDSETLSDSDSDSDTIYTDSDEDILRW
jgi:type III secretory pathway component EscR